MIMRNAQIQIILSIHTFIIHLYVPFDFVSGQCGFLDCARIDSHQTARMRSVSPDLHLRCPYAPNKLFQ